CLVALGILAGRELVHLFPAPFRPSEPLVLGGILLCLAANWFPVVRTEVGYPDGSVWALLVFIFAVVLIAGFLVEMYRFREPGSAVPRLGATLLAVAYLGVLPCFFAQLRFLPAERTWLLIALTIFVPKGNDVFAFFTGTFLGKHKMTPILSPKK